MIKILHIGDVHLDSPFAGVDIATSERLRSGLRELFIEIIKSSHDCDLILLPGDLFDCGYVNPDTLSAVAEAFADFGKPIVIAPGNHDPYYAGGIWSSISWSDNVHIFKDETLSVFKLEINSLTVAVHGWAFASDRLDRSPLADGLVLEKDAINLICAHADTSSAISKYAPTPLSLFASSGADYAALSHIHNAPEPTVAGITTVAYSSFPEGRSFDELGYGSVVYLTIDEGCAPVIERRTTSRHRYMVAHLDLTGLSNDSEVASLIADYASAEGYDENVSLKVYLEGSISPDYKPSLERIGELVPMKTQPTIGRLCSLVLRDRTSPIFGAEHLESDVSIKGELYRALLPRLSSPDEEERALAAEALRIGLLALDGKAFT